MLALSQQLSRQQRYDPERNGGIGQVEGRPVPSPGMQIEEVCHRRVMEPVGRISDGAAHDRAEGHRLEPTPCAGDPDHEA